MENDVATLLARHTEALALFTERVHAVGADQWDAPTPCTDWSVRDLVNHLTAEQLWVPPLVTEGAGIEDIGDAYDGDVLGRKPKATWDAASRAARKAFAAEGALEQTVLLSYGETPAVAYCAQMITDAVVHTWDLSRALGAQERLPDVLVSFALEEVTPYASGLAKSGLFAPPIEPPPGDSHQTRLLALLGRRA
ncbi:TIGR03086 family protein [Streptomyces lunaelactis]|uniref:TIGR03086 family metal-binding protein n=1 Tax=Streptomyces lunaelactis TaxID=1535768 RepID=UPI001585169A|nr:TIGR03086 family metal-binding protein [Streptomyces lunaelactis]NUK07310.1 TIGR03086 family protein [Streptomyces lunaelactis]NUK24575.1 TIGR03086 family protein [Streptomyces lunaelactis]NUK59102.1 TIGR03086 family protein [Streptomyces lunaelactis]NUL04619.1 TIGR03086 family protein [Streptomyces lunaelactis]NUL13640.1 TIGR03086 family protein [Streptomyces lunaelactis]